MKLKISLLLFLLLISACRATSSGSADAMRVVELETRYDELLTRYHIVQARLLELDTPGGELNFFAPQIIREQTKFVDTSDTVQDVRERGFLRCGGNADVPGFGFLDPDQGRFVGFDIDICRAIAVAVLGEGGAENIDIVPLTSRLRFAALQSAEIDVLIRNTTHTLSRDAELRVNFGPVTFYDGQGMLVRSNSGIRKLTDMTGLAVCVQASSTSASNVVAYFANLGLPIEIIEFDDREAAREQYEAETCEGFTGDKSSLLAQRTLLDEPDRHFILSKDMSREPLAPVVRHGDDAWLDIVRWSIECLFNAELLGVSAENVDEMLLSEDTNIKNLLGVETELGMLLGLSNDFCYQIIKQIGNYDDIYTRHLGPDTQFNLPRDLNLLYIDGGLIYPTPFK